MKIFNQSVIALLLLVSSSVFASEIDGALASFDENSEITDYGDLSAVTGCGVRMDEKSFLVCVDMLNVKMTENELIAMILAGMAHRYGVSVDAVLESASTIATK